MGQRRWINVARERKSLPPPAHGLRPELPKHAKAAPSAATAVRADSSGARPPPRRCFREFIDGLEFAY